MKKALAIFGLELLVAASTLLGQPHQTITDGFTPPGLGAGTPSGSYPLSSFDTIDFFSGKLNFRLPLVSVKGRGETSFTPVTHIQSQWRYVDYYPNLCPNSGCPNGYVESATWDQVPLYSPGKMAYRTARAVNLQTAGSTCLVAEFTLLRLTFIGGDGSEIPFVDKMNNGGTLTNLSAPSCTATATAGARGRIFLSTDGSAATFISDTNLSDFQEPGALGQPTSEGPVTGTLFFRDGTRYQIFFGLVLGIWDRHGNKTTFAYANQSTLGALNDDPNTHALLTITDSLGRNVNITYNNASTTTNDSGVIISETCDHLTYNGFQSPQGRVAKVCFADLDQVLKLGSTVQTYVQLFEGEINTSQIGTFNPRVVSSVKIANGKQYSFSYNPYAEVAKVKLPTGGWFQYTHGRGTGTDPQGGDLGGIYSLMVYRRVKDKKTYDENGTLLLTETFTTALASSPFVVTVIRKDAANTQLAKEQHTFYENPIASLAFAATNYPNWSEGKEYLTNEFAGTSTTALKSAQMNWAQSGSTVLVGPQQDPRITQTITTTDGQASSQVFCFDAFSNKTHVYEYDFGSAPALATYCQLPNNTAVPTGYTRLTQSTFATQNFGSHDLVNVVDSSGVIKPLTGEDGIYHQRSLPSATTVYNGASVVESQVSYIYDHNAAYNPDPTSTAWTSNPYTGLTNWDNRNRVSRGNLTKITKLLKNPVTSTNSNVDTVLEYDQVGNLTRMTMPTGSYSAAYSSTLGYAYATNFKNPLGHLASRSYDSNTGLVSTFNSPTGFSITYGYESGLDRLSTITPTVGGATSITYDDTARTIATSTYQNSCANGSYLQTTNYFDGLGRSYKVGSVQGQGTSYVESQFDGLGRLYKASQPRFSGTAAWTTNTYDDLGRLRTATDPSNTITNYDYSGADVTITEMYSATGTSGPVRKMTHDAFGRLKQVIEDPSSKNLKTTYTYDALDNLKTVTQQPMQLAPPATQLPTQPQRLFYYDTFSRLVKATNPESGDTLYEYL